MRYIIHSDGGARGNPGPAAAGFLIHDESGKVIHRGGNFLGTTTNNVAEYYGVIDALQWLVECCGTSGIISGVMIVLDSDLLVRQLTGQYRIKSSRLRPLAIMVKSFERRLGIPVTYRHVVRAENREADLVVNEILDHHKTDMK